MKIVGRKEIGSGKWLALEQLEYRDGDRTRFWETVSRKRCAGAVLLIAELLPSHRLLLIRQFYDHQLKLKQSRPHPLVWELV